MTILPKPLNRPLGKNGPVTRINTFISRLSSCSPSGGFAKGNRYEVLFYTAQLALASKQIGAAVLAKTQYTDEAIDWIKSYYEWDVQDIAISLTAFCDKTELPAYQFATQDQRFYGPGFKVPHLPEYQDTTMTFYCGGDMAERYFFDSWMYLVMDPVTNNFNYREEYAIDIEIVEYNEYDEPIYRVYLFSAFPVAINAIGLSYNDLDAIQKLEVTFTYKYAMPFQPNSPRDGSRGTISQYRDTVSKTAHGPSREEQTKGQAAPPGSFAAPDMNH